MNWIKIFLLLLIPFQLSAQVPDMNSEIVKFVNAQVGKSVGKGECWDLANAALTHVKANWDHEYKYGKKIDPNRDVVFMGDMIQFENVEIEYEKDGTIYTETMSHHTAVIVAVKAKGEYEIAHQNNGFSGRTVGKSVLKLKDVKKGELFFYRPVPGGK